MLAAALTAILTLAGCGGTTSTPAVAPVLTWTAPAAIAYGVALSATQLNATASVPGTFAYSPAVGATLNAGAQTLNVTFTPTDSRHYSAESASVTLTVNPAVLAISWTAPAAITYGTTLSGTQLDATSNGVGAFVYTPAAGTVLGAGVHTLSATFTPTVASNYTTASATATALVTVNPAALTVNWAPPAAISYGTALSATQLDATANGVGVFAYTPAAGTVLKASTYTLAVTFSPSDPEDYTTPSANGSASLTVKQATPAIAWPTPAAVPVGTTLSSTQLNASAAATVAGQSSALTGNFAYTPPAGTVISTAGSQTLSVVFTPTDGTDYSSTSGSVSLSVFTGTPSYTWKNVQIVGGGYVPGILMHPKQQGLMYARTDVGGAYRYDAAAKSWTPLTDWVTRANSTEIGIESVAVDPNDPQRLYLAVGLYTDSWWPHNGSMLVSSDQGNTFTTVAMPFKMGANDDGRSDGERLAVDPNNGANVFFGSRLNGLWASHDHGVSWAQVTSFPGTVTTSTPGTLATSGAGVVFEIFVKTNETAGASTNTIYAGVSATGTTTGGVTDPQALYVSKDAGATWAAVAGTPTGMYVNHGVLSADGTALYFSFGDAIGPTYLTSGAIKKYTLPNASATNGVWTDITPPRATGYQGGYGSVAVDAENPSVIMVSTLDHYYPVGDDLWRSLDGGATWYSINTVGANRDGSLSPWVYFGASAINNTGNWVTSLQIDPFDSNHVVYGTGQTIWNTDNMRDSDSGGASNWTVDAQGVEETVALGLISPPSGPAHLLSQVGDICGFQHTDLTKSPAAGMMENPQCTSGSGIDFAQSNPLIMARVGSGGGAFGATSADGGTTWTPFATQPGTTTQGSGYIAVSADGGALVWAPNDGPTNYSVDGGKTWTASTGAPAQKQVVSDRVTPSTFYIYEDNTGTLWKSTDSGKTFTHFQTGLPGGGFLTSSPAGPGDLWLSAASGLFHTNSAGSLTQLSNVQTGWGLAVGAPALGTTQLTYYLGGQIAGQAGIFRSTDGGATWIRIDDAQHEYGYINAIAADPRVFGRVYLGTGGRGIVYGDSTF